MGLKILATRTMPKSLPSSYGSIVVPTFYIVLSHGGEKTTYNKPIHQSPFSREEEQYDASTDTDAALFKSSLRVSNRLPIMAIVLLGFVTALLTLIVFLGVPVRNPGVLSDDDSALYITGTAISASLISSFTSGQIKTLRTVRILDQPATISSERSRDFARVKVFLGRCMFSDAAKKLFSVKRSHLQGRELPKSHIFGHSAYIYRRLKDLQRI